MATELLSIPSTHFACQRVKAHGVRHLQPDSAIYTNGRSAARSLKPLYQLNAGVSHSKPFAAEQITYQRHINGRLWGGSKGYGIDHRGTQLCTQTIYSVPVPVSHISRTCTLYFGLNWSGITDATVELTSTNF
jgi:hypothetical protein